MSKKECSRVGRKVGVTVRQVAFLAPGDSSGLSTDFSPLESAEEGEPGAGSAHECGQHCPAPSLWKPAVPPPVTAGGTIFSFQC